MLTHGDIWQAVDRLAHRQGLSASGLARRAGLDPTTFNPSKRRTSEGKLRWPSTESVSKILDATGCSLVDFVGLIADEAPKRAPHVPIIGYAQAGASGFFDDAGYPLGSGWDEVVFPDIGDPHAYALEITGDSMVPVYRAGDTIVVSPQSGVRRGDRVVVRTADGEVMVKQLGRRSARRVELQSFNPEYADIVLPPDRIQWMARVVWASQ